MKTKIFISIAVALLSFSNAFADDFENGASAAKNIGHGWNLGNTLDANNQTVYDVTSPDYWGQQGLESETCWGQPKTTKELITMMKKAGVTSIRVPVTWYNHMDKDGNVNAEWMARVKEVVDYVIDNGLYCILNVHHDTGADGSAWTSWLKADETNYTTNKERYEGLWKQIATEFKDYDQHLLFESYNEMLDAQSTWNAPKNASSYNAINSYAQSFVDAVRATGGNNASRNLICNTYAAANSDAVTKFTFPTDLEANAKNHLILQVHAYPNFYTWTNPTLKTIDQVKAEIDYIITTLKTNVINKGYGAIIGEWGSYGVDNGAGKTDYDLHKDMFFEFIKYFMTQAKTNGIGMCYWMGLSDGDYRKKPAFNQADLAEVMAKAYHGDDFKGEYPILEKSDSVVAFEGEKTIGWGDPITISATSFSLTGSPCKLHMTYEQTTDADTYIQSFYGDWSHYSNESFDIDGKTYPADKEGYIQFDPSSTYGTKAGTVHTTVYSFDKATTNNFKSKGILFQGVGVKITKVVLTSDSSTGVQAVNADVAPSSDAVYNTAGQRVSSNYKGIIIKNGKKILCQ